MVTCSLDAVQLAVQTCAPHYFKKAEKTVCRSWGSRSLIKSVIAYLEVCLIIARRLCACVCCADADDNRYLCVPQHACHHVLR